MTGATRSRMSLARQLSLMTGAVIALSLVIVLAVAYEALTRSALSGAARLTGLSFPSAWFTLVSLGTFTKGLGFAELWPDILVVLLFALGLVSAAVLILRKQEA